MCFLGPERHTTRLAAALGDIFLAAETVLGMGHTHAPVSSVGLLRPVRYAYWAALALVAFALVLSWPSSRGGENGAVYTRVSAKIAQTEPVACGVNRCVEVAAVLPDGTDVPLGLVSQDSQLGSLEPGAKVVLGFEESTGYYFYLDVDRQPRLLLLAGLFVVAVLCFARKTGMYSLLSLVGLGSVLYWYTAPALISGADPVRTCTLTAAVAVLCSSVASHGLRSAATAVASLAMLAALAVAWVLVSFAAPLFAFTGAVSDEVALVRSILPGLDFEGLLYGSILIGFAGALDDVVLTQVAAVAELVGSHASRRSLFTSALRVGRAHLAASVNTLALAYLGASLPLLLLFSLSDSPAGLVLSEEAVAGEVVRMVLGTLGLVAAIPIATAGAVLLLLPAADPPAPQKH